MTARRTAAVAVLGTVGFLLPVSAAGPAAAHGAPTSPVSRVAACGPEGDERSASAACQAARDASGERAFAEWDNLRLPDVAGRDREVVPDGKLCSAGIERYRGLDLPRADWPATKLVAGAEHAFTYRTTIPHKGTFRFYVTKEGYDPAQRLRWSDLESQPFLKVTDPPVRQEAYRFSGRLPTGKSGRHLIYTIWQNSDTPDTYYSCSDVVFGGTGAGGTDGAAAGGAGNDAGQGSRPPGAIGAAERVSTASKTTQAVPVVAGGAAALLGVVALIMLRRRRP